MFFLLGAVIGSIFTSEQSVTGAANLVIVPLGFISGSFIPLTGMPDWVHVAVSWSPLYQLNVALNATLSEGRGVDAVLVPTAIIAIAGVVLFAIASRTFHWVGRNE
ncbi:ABC transporter permease [Oerskovia sp. M15]